MAILLKNYIKKQYINEIIYKYPKFDSEYYNNTTSYGKGRESGRQMFYDFYAMEFLWSFLGSGQISKQKRQADVGSDDASVDIVPNSTRILPAAAVKTIDSLYEQVTNAVASNLITYIQLAVVQEFRYLLSESYSWSYFRRELMDIYRKKGTVTKSEFDNLVKKHIPKMAAYPKTLKRLLKFSKYYIPNIYGSAENEPFDNTRKDIYKPEEPYNATDIEEPSQTISSTDPEPQNSDKVRRRKFGKYGNDVPSPYDQEWSGNTSFNPIDKLPEIPNDADEDDSKSTSIDEVNMSTIKNVHIATGKAGVTLDDIKIAFNYIPWNEAYGGPAWGSGVIGLLNLLHAKKKLTTEDMNGIIDHIYDLQHNTGSLLNKGPMYIESDDLDRRYRTRDITRFLPYVSSTVKNIIIRYYQYIQPDPDKAKRELNMSSYINLPSIGFSEDEISEMEKHGFTDFEDNTVRIGLKSKNKKGYDTQDGYIITKKIIDDKEKYLLTDYLKSDAKLYDTLDAAINYAMERKHDTYRLKSPETKLYAYIASKTISPLTPSQELDLVQTLGMGKNYSSDDYYFRTFQGKRIALYVFADKTTLVKSSDSSKFQIFGDYHAAKNYLAQILPPVEHGMFDYWTSIVKSKIEKQLALDKQINNPYAPKLTTHAPAASVPQKLTSQDGIRLIGFEKNLTDAGFVWDGDNKCYVHQKNPSIIVIIHGNKTSDIRFGESEGKTINNLPQLFSYVKSDTFKSKLNVTPQQTNSTNIESENNTFVDYNGRQLAKDILTKLKSEGISIDSNMNFSADDKVLAIKSTRQVIEEKLNTKISLADAKWIGENLKVFIEYLKHNNIPNIANTHEFISDIVNRWKAANTFSEKSNSEIVNDIIKLLNDNNITVQADSTNVPPDKKILAIKLLREYLYLVGGEPNGLAATKYAVENFNKFIEYIKTCGLPDMDPSSVTLNELIDAIHNKTPMVSKHTRNILNTYGFKHIGKNHDGLPIYERQTSTYGIGARIVLQSNGEYSIWDTNETTVVKKQKLAQVLKQKFQSTQPV